MNRPVAKFDRRLWVVFALGTFLFLMTWLSTLRDRDSQQSTSFRMPRRLAPAFRLYDQNSQLVNLAAYLNRHKLVLVFFDGQASPLNDVVLKSLHEQQDRIDEAGYRIFGISTALPQQNRAAIRDDFVFPLLSDPAAIQPGSVHRTWGCLRPPNSQNSEATTIPKVFVVDRLGRVNWQGSFPTSVERTKDFSQRLLAGDFD